MCVFVGKSFQIFLVRMCKRMSVFVTAYAITQLQQGQDPLSVGRILQRSIRLMIPVMSLQLIGLRLLLFQAYREQFSSFDKK